MVKNYYDQYNAISETPQTLSFESNFVRLDIPEEGTLTKGGWTVESVTNPVVIK